jgi:hypothetical protein
MTEVSVDLIKQLIAKGSQCIVPLGAALIPHVVNPAVLEERSKIPVLNTLSITLRFAETCVNLGMRQSPLTYPQAKLSLEDFAS